MIIPSGSGIPRNARRDTPGSTPFHDYAAAVPDLPELYVAAAFAGAFLFARILRKIAE